MMLDKIDHDFITRLSPAGCIGIIESCLRHRNENGSNLWKQLMCPAFFENLKDVSTARDLHDAIDRNWCDAGVQVLAAVSDGLGPEKFRRFMDLKARHARISQVTIIFNNYLDGFKSGEKSNDKHHKFSEAMMLVCIEKGAGLDTVFTDIIREDFLGDRALMMRRLSLLINEMKIPSEKLLSREGVVRMFKTAGDENTRRQLVEILDKFGLDFSVITDKAGKLPGTLRPDVAAIIQAIIARQHLQRSAPSSTSKAAARPS